MPTLNQEQELVNIRPGVRKWGLWCGMAVRIGTTFPRYLLRVSMYSFDSIIDHL